MRGIEKQKNGLKTVTYTFQKREFRDNWRMWYPLLACIYYLLTAHSRWMFAHISHVADDSILTLVTFHRKRPANVTFKFLISENTKISRQKLYQTILVG